MIIIVDRVKSSFEVRKKPNTKLYFFPLSKNDCSLPKFVTGAR